MNETIELEILRLIEEISAEEKELERLEKEADGASRKEYAKNRYSSKIKNCKDSLDRKISLLRSLKIS